MHILRCLQARRPCFFLPFLTVDPPVNLAVVSHDSKGRRGSRAITSTPRGAQTRRVTGPAPVALTHPSPAITTSAADYRTNACAGGRGGGGEHEKNNIYIYIHTHTVVYITDENFVLPEWYGITGCTLRKRAFQTRQSVRQGWLYCNLTTSGIIVGRINDTASIPLVVYLWLLATQGENIRLHRQSPLPPPPSSSQSYLTP